MKFYHCEWCRNNTPEDESLEWTILPTPDGEYTYCPSCSVALKTVLGNRPEYVSKILKLNNCLDGLMGAIGDWVQCKFKDSAIPTHTTGSDYMLKDEYDKVRSEYLEIAKLLIEDDTDA